MALITKRKTMHVNDIVSRRTSRELYDYYGFSFDNPQQKNVDGADVKAVFSSQYNPNYTYVPGKYEAKTTSLFFPVFDGVANVRLSVKANIGDSLYLDKGMKGNFLNRLPKEWE